MKTVRTIFVTLELSAILAVALLAFMQVDSEYNFFKGIYITLFAILAVVCEKEQHKMQEMIEEEKENQMIDTYIDLLGDEQYL